MPCHILGGINRCILSCSFSASVFEDETLTRLVFPKDPDVNYFYTRLGSCQNLNDADHHTLFQSTNVPRGMKHLQIVTMVFNLGDLEDYVGEFTESVTIHADTVTNNAPRPLNLKVNFSLTVVARRAFINKDIKIEMLLKDIVENGWSITYEVKYGSIGDLILRKRFIGPITIIDTKPRTKRLRPSDMMCAPTILPTVADVEEKQFYVVYNSNYMNLMFICITMLRGDVSMQEQFTEMLHFLHELATGVELSEADGEQGETVTRIRNFIQQSGMFGRPLITPIPFSSKQDLLTLLEKKVEFIENYYSNEFEYQREMIKKEAESSADIQGYIREMRESTIFRKKIGDVINQFRKENIENFKGRFTQLMQSSLKLVSQAMDAVFQTQQAVALANQQLAVRRAETQVAKTEAVLESIRRVSGHKLDTLQRTVNAVCVMPFRYVRRRNF